MPRYSVRVTVLNDSGKPFTTFDVIEAEQVCHKDAGQLEFYVDGQLDTVYPPGKWERCQRIPETE